MSDALFSLTVLAPTAGDDGATENPVGGAIALSRPNSPGLLALKGMEPASSSVAACFSAGDAFFLAMIGSEETMPRFRQLAYRHRPRGVVAALDSVTEMHKPGSHVVAAHPDQCNATRAESRSPTSTLAPSSSTRSSPYRAPR